MSQGSCDMGDSRAGGLSRCQHKHKSAFSSHWSTGQLSPGMDGAGWWVGRDAPDSYPMPPTQDTELSIHPHHRTGGRLRRDPATEGN